MQQQAGERPRMVRRSGALVRREHVNRIRVTRADDRESLRNQGWTQPLRDTQGHVFFGSARQLRAPIRAAVRRVKHNQIAIERRQRLWQCGRWLNRERLGWR